ncbi:ATP-binding protein [Stutzerimonas xanthomarina]|uniref:ATP-binding protein n=1 Tax=Stutzerimonas xanthomarina TaxID=271420 RepID=UPI003AA9253F
MSATIKDQLFKIKRQIEKEKTRTLTLPNRFAFREHGVFDFEEVVSFFEWDIHNCPVKIDLTNCSTPNYQALSLLILYAWKLKSQGCRVSFIESNNEIGASAMWRTIGARGFMPVLLSKTQNFRGHQYKPLLAIRNSDDFKKAIETVEKFSNGFNIEYLNTLRYVLSELLYNTLEHGSCYEQVNGQKVRTPSIIQFTYYQKSNEIHFIIADNGIGIKRHIEQAYPGQESHEDAIKLAIKPKVSGTFGKSDPYKQKNNAGIGLYISTSIIRKLNANMHILSGDGLLHISPRDVTGRTLKTEWPGTLVLVTLRLDENPSFVLHKAMQEFRDAADKELKQGDASEEKTRYYISIYNFFGAYAEDKEAAIKYRDKYIFKAIEAGKTLVLDFENVISAPHSFLSALLASPAKTLGMNAFKKIRFTNATPEIRETLDFIMDENTDLE